MWEVLTGGVAGGTIMEDLKTLTTAVATGDWTGLSDKLASGSAGKGAASTTGTPTDQTFTSSANGQKVIDQARVLGSAAKGYSQNVALRNGPDYYDCSGLVYATLKSLGLYSGNTFTTSTFEHIASGFATKVDTPAVGDIVIWPSHHHMGIVDQGGDVYSAESPSLGIKDSPYSYYTSTWGVPDIWRVN